MENIENTFLCLTEARFKAYLCNRNTQDDYNTDSHFSHLTTVHAHFYDNHILDSNSYKRSRQL